MTELKPCPRCGGKAELHSDGWRIWWDVQCYNCLHMTQRYRTEKEAMDVWNGGADNDR